MWWHNDCHSGLGMKRITPSPFTNLSLWVAGKTACLSNEIKSLVNITAHWYDCTKESSQHTSILSYQNYVLLYIL